VAAGFGLIPLGGADAASTRSVDAYADRFEPKRLDIEVGDTVAWNIFEGEHKIVPKDKWGDNDGHEGTLKPGDPDRYQVRFDKPNLYKYYCEIHGDVGANNTLLGMHGEINVTDPTVTTTPPPPPPPPPPGPVTTTTTAAPPTPQTTTPPASSAGALSPTTTAPRPTTTNPPKPDKNKKPPKEEETTTTTTAPAPPPPVDIPDEAIIPSLPGSKTQVQHGNLEGPGDAPEGEAIALLKSKRGGNGKKLLIASGLGLGLLGVGTAGYKFVNRSSRYFPA
jgi:plastocyanin